MNATIEKFGHPASLVHEFEHWLVLVRPVQLTLGSLVLAAKSGATAYGALSPAAFSEQAAVIPAIEAALQPFCQYERINYLMLMMVDPHVHFHVVPRYSRTREWQGIGFPDIGWPGPPELKTGAGLTAQQLSAMAAQLAIQFRQI
ncbi:MAG TPA: HIT family protein [Sphingomicrobium sp.]|nr:HIT family protein [Sphingomicrobium sp.]